MAFPLKLMLIVAATIGTMTGARAAEVPTLNVSPTCRPLSHDQAFPIDTDRCLRTEREARSQLEKQWTQYPAADRALCTQTAQMGGLPSYVELITCLEMKRDVAKLPANDSLTSRPSSLRK
jgi:hypothetical protein